MSPRTVVFVVGPLVSGPSGFQHPVYFVSSCLRPIRCGCLRESVVFLLSCPNPACPSSGLRASRRTVPIARSRLFLRLLSELPGLCLRALSGHSGSFRGIPAPFFRPFAAARSPYLCGTAAPFSRLQSVPMRNTPRSLRRFCYPVRNPHVRGSSESCRDVPCSRGTTPRCVLP